MAKRTDLTGATGAFFSVLGDDGTRASSGAIHWKCLCVCGSVFRTTAAEFKRGDRKSCGCKKIELISSAITTHGMSGSSLYQIWSGVVDRCTNHLATGYENYGGRGITICERWRKFENFLTDMGERPSSEHSIERVDNDEGYTPANCKWATRSEQQYNKRKSKNCTSAVKGVYYNAKMGKWVARSLESHNRKYLGAHLTEGEAIQAVKDYHAKKT